MMEKWKDGETKNRNFNPDQFHLASVIFHSSFAWRVIAIENKVNEYPSCSSYGILFER